VQAQLRKTQEVEARSGLQTLTYTDHGNQNHVYAVSQELIVLDNREVGFSAVLLLAAIWLFGSGILGLVEIYRRKKSAYRIHIVTAFLGVLICS
jgi:hypothetical protein